MDSSYNFPKLRWPLDVSFDSHGQEPILIIRCPLGVSPEPLVLTAAIAPVVGTLDGSKSFDQILADFGKIGLSSSLLRELIELLDQRLFLANPRYFVAEKELREAFELCTVRPAALAGLTYASNAEDLTRFIQSVVPTVSSIMSMRGPLLGLMAPHIDYRRGGSSYGLTYATLSSREEDLYILLGTAHQYSQHMFHLTAKDFASPLGDLGCDVDFVTKLASLHGLERSFADQILHRKEHSLELQIPFIKHFRPNSKIVPILVGSFHRMLQVGKEPKEDQEYSSFVSALTEVIAEARGAGRKISVICGVDMAHVGRAFGDQGSLSPELMLEVERRDRQYLEILARQDCSELFGHIYQDQDKRRICGFPTMYLMMDVLRRLGIRYQAELVDYKQAVGYQTDCAVTFAGMTFYEPQAGVVDLEKTTKIT